jgi:hypothetical protein
VDTNSIGDLSTAQIIARLLKIGKTVLIPFGNKRYDLVLDEDGVFKRIQCKTGRLKNGVIEFKTSSVDRAGKNIHYKGQVEAFGVYCPELDKTYLIPISKTGKKSCSLRVQESINKQVKKTNLASDFEI